MSSLEVGEHAETYTGFLEPENRHKIKQTVTASGGCGDKGKELVI